MVDASDIEAVLAAIDDFGRCLEAQDLGGTLALLADDPDVTVIPSEGVETHRGRPAVEAFVRRIYAAPKRYSWRWRDRWVSTHAGWASFVAIGDELVAVAGAERSVIPYCLTGMLVRHDGRWQFLLLHGSEESSAARPGGSLATADAAPAARPMTDQVLRQATLDDVGEIESLMKASIRDLFPMFYDDAQTEASV